MQDPGERNHGRSQCMLLGNQKRKIFSKQQCTMGGYLGVNARKSRIGVFTDKTGFMRDLDKASSNTFQACDKMIVRKDTYQQL